MAQEYLLLNFRVCVRWLGVYGTHIYAALTIEYSVILISTVCFSFTNALFYSLRMISTYSTSCFGSQPGQICSGGTWAASGVKHH